MTLARFHVTFETVTPESAAQGDADSRGFVDPGQWLTDTTNAPCGPAFLPIKAACAMRLREAVDLVGLVEDSGHWFTELDGRQNYQTGAETRYSLHPPDNITGASYGRLQRLLRVR